jgi:hypothetical protein
VVADRQGGRALGIKLLAFRERRSHVEAVARSTHGGAERKFKRLSALGVLPALMRLT